ncbi:hypothetical protein [Clavibacter michiganensis]|uniref:hypothetical protein n=1 Tax=Clavibacter michiganensis TaxID=28447 RepID=UPI003D9FF87B
MPSADAPAVIQAACDAECDEEVVDVNDMHDVYGAARSAARRAVEDGRCAGDVVADIASPGEWEALSTSSRGDITVQGALWGAVDALRTHRVPVAAVRAAGVATCPAGAKMDDQAIFVEWVAGALERGSDPYTVDNDLAVELVRRWERGNPRIMSLVVAIVEVATQAAAAPRSAS